MISSLYIGATGMKTHARGMQVLGNNIANVNTVGFKNSNAIFANLMSQYATTDTSRSVGYSQVGMGSRLQDIKVNWNQGSFETTNSICDMGIAGLGLFGVKNEGELLYTRAGNFHIDKEGYMVDPHGYRLQGTRRYGDTAGTSGDIRFEPDANGQIVLDPKATTLIKSYNNLGSGDKTSSNTNPFFALSQQWNGNASPPLQESTYAYSTSLTIYDDNGNSHEVTIYFDEATSSNAAKGTSNWEFVVGLNPAEDGRDAFAGTSAAGMLMMGTLTFNSEGQLMNMSAFTNNGSGGKALANWVPSGFSEDGFPLLEATFSDGANASIGLDLGLTNQQSSWSQTVSNASAVGNKPSVLPYFDGKRGATSTTNYTGSSSTLYSSQDGYAKGFMNTFSVDSDGTIIGKFSNGQTQDLWQVNLYNFTNPYGLKAEGNNHWSATSAAGAEKRGFAGEDNFGYIAQNALEQSNVELSREFVNMITTQRGFQANSKIITTSDTVLQSALNMKR